MTPEWPCTQHHVGTVPGDVVTSTSEQIPRAAVDGCAVCARREAWLPVVAHAVDWALRLSEQILLSLAIPLRSLTRRRVSD
jgi:hypothetical protein